MTYIVRPISDRTGFTTSSTYSDFTVTWSTAEQLLLAELRRVKASNVVMELDVKESQLRIDGRPRADAKPSSRAVRIIFDTPDGATATFATNKFVGRYSNLGMLEDWQHNVYAIAKGLEGLRMLKRYGISERDQLYAGFKQLSAGTAMGGPTSSHLTATDAQKRVMSLANWGAVWPADDGGLARLLRRAKFEAHPDRNAGDDTRWAELAEALTVLRLS